MGPLKDMLWGGGTNEMVKTDIVKFINSVFNIIISHKTNETMLHRRTSNLIEDILLTNDI